jgi:hypothetical protein
MDDVIYEAESALCNINKYLFATKVKIIKTYDVLNFDLVSASYLEMSLEYFKKFKLRDF